MKKLLFILLILITGCTKTIKLNINPFSITNIVYENKNILNNNYLSILQEINDKNLYELIDDSIIGDNLTINTNNATYNFEIAGKYLIYNVDNHRYFTSTNNLDIILNNIVEK